MDTLTKEQRKKCMSPIHSKDTGIEMPLREALWRKGYRIVLLLSVTVNPGTGKIGSMKTKIAQREKSGVSDE